MSQATIPFQPAPLLDDAPLSLPEGDDTDNNRRAVLVLVALGALALLGLAAYFLLFAGGGDQAPAATAPSSNAAPKPAAPAPAVKAPALQPKLSSKRYGTDPFKPLIQDVVVAPAAPAAAPGASPPFGATGVTAGAGPSTIGGTSTAPRPPATGGSTGGPGSTTGPAPTSHLFRVVAIDAGNTTSTVKVDGKRYTDVGISDVFATQFKALRYEDGKCGVFQFGDERFDLCEGDAVRLR